MPPSSSASHELLAIHPGALGDVLQAVPALRALRELGGGSRVTFAGQPRLARLLLGTGVVDAALHFEGLGLEHLFASDPVPDQVRARLAGFGRVVSWFGTRADGYPERLRSIVADAVVAPPVPAEDVTVWEHLLGTVAGWRVEPSPRRAPLDLPAAWRDEARGMLTRLGAATGQPLLFVHSGAGAPAKRWPVARFARVIRAVVARAGCQVLVHQGPADLVAARELTTELAAAPRVPVLALLEPPLDLLAATLGDATAYLGADSGVSHLAAAIGTRAVILYSPEYRGPWAPWGPNASPLTMTGDDGDASSAADMLAMILRAWPSGPDGRGRPRQGTLDSPVGPS